ncbi:hypothetical protein F9C11_31545 [Amycolatopsis sp. VS8301801F10]|uniref:hypothetical protein n=1 Tax=Amycolatopsis sp. VS8301801F10 TaxID=2652442 RepID=UPI0038FD04A0
MESARLEAVEDGLGFGWWEMRDGSRRYTGWLGLFDDEAGEPVLLSRRARVATALDGELLDHDSAGAGALVGEAALTAGRTGRMPCRC